MMNQKKKPGPPLSASRLRALRVVPDKDNNWPGERTPRPNFQYTATLCATNTTTTAAASVT